VPVQDNVDQKNVTEEIADDQVLDKCSALVLRVEGLETANTTQQLEILKLKARQVLDKCSALVLRVEGLETANTTQQLEILKLKARVKKLERLNKVKSSKLRRLKKVGTSQRIESSEDLENVVATSTPILAAKPDVVAISTPISAAKPKVLKIAVAAPAVSTRKRKRVVIRDPKEELHDDTPAETFSAKDKGKGILVEDPKPMKKKDQIEIDAEYARNMQEDLNKENEESFKKIDWNTAFDHVQAKDSREEIEKEEEEIIKSINETSAQKAAKKRRLCEQAKENKDLKKQLEVVVDKDDDVFIEATPIGKKVPVVNYEIVMINNKPRFTLEQLVNVARLQVEEENEMSLELLRFTRQQLLEYQQE
nr:hypothetical protein [Tanacetum cinerariifolium]